MLSSIQFSVWKWNAYIRAYKVHHIEHILYVSESICFTDNELNLVISCFNPGITHTIAAVWSYISDGPYKTYEWNSTKLEFKHRTNKEITGLSYMTSLVIQALKTLGKNNVTPEVIQTLSTKLSLSEKQACLKEATESTDWVYDTIRQICGSNTL